MKQDALKQYLSARTALLTEKSHLETRLREIDEALGEAEIPKHGPMHAVASPLRRRRKMSAAGRARIAGAARARWAKIRAGKAAKAMAKTPRKGNGTSKRGSNTITLREALLKLTASKPLTRQQLIDGLEGVGYHSTSKDPGNVMNRFLYGKTAILKNAGGKFSQK